MNPAMIPTNTPIFSAGASRTDVKYPSTGISVPNSVCVTADSSASMSPVTPKIAPVIRLIRIKLIPAAKAPPALSLAQLPPIARAKRICRFPIIAHPIFSITLPKATRAVRSGLISGIDPPILIIRPAAGITAMTPISAFPNFCQNSKFIIFFIIYSPILQVDVFILSNGFHSII